MDKLQHEIKDRIEHIKEIDMAINEMNRAIEEIQADKAEAITLKNNLRMEIREDMLSAQKPHVKIDDYADVSLKKGRDKLEITEPDKIPDAYIAKVTVQHDKKAIEKALKAGIPVEGATWVTSDSVLEIKFK